MSSHSNNYEQKLQPSSAVTTIFYIFIAIGLATFAAGLATDAARIWRSYLIYNLLFLGVAIGAAFFLAVHYLASSGWFVAIRRIPEAMTSYLQVGAFTTLGLLFGLPKIYPWTNHEFMESDHFLHHKTGYFSTGFFAFRLLLFFAVVLYFTWKFRCNSLQQDSAGGVELRNKQKPLSAGFIVLFAPLFTIFTIDIVKSLEPKWFSTIFGVYVFSGFMQTAVAVMIIALFFLKRSGYLNIVKEDHVHDLSKFLFGWSVFWAYICFSQYMLIWYANLPEETFYYINRQQGSWLWVGPILLLIKFVLPFLLLLPRAAKRCVKYSSVIATLVIISQCLDLHWMIMPSFSPNGIIFGWQDVGMFLGFLGLFAISVRRFLAKNPMVPMKDPYLHESENHHVIFA